MKMPLTREEKIAAIKAAIKGSLITGGDGMIDRYSVIGRASPNPATVCKGHCDGLGFYPTKDRTKWPAGAVPDVIGYVFVTCETCGGTGLRVGADQPA